MLRRLSHENSPLLHSLVTLYPLGILFLDHGHSFSIFRAFAHILYSLMLMLFLLVLLHVLLLMLVLVLVLVLALAFALAFALVLVSPNGSHPRMTFTCQSALQANFISSRRTRR